MLDYDTLIREAEAAEGAAIALHDDSTWVDDAALADSLFNEAHQLAELALALHRAADCVLGATRVREARQEMIDNHEECCLA